MIFKREKNTRGYVGEKKKMHKEINRPRGGIGDYFFLWSKCGVVRRGACLATRWEKVTCKRCLKLKN